MNKLKEYWGMFLALLSDLFGSAEPFEVPPEVERKQYDTTKLTRQDHDVIMHEYSLYRQCKKAKGRAFKSTLEDVTDKLNQILEYNKSRCSYAKVWEGKVARESLGERAICV